ncbi:uncharacterized protein LOC134237142 isoform X2 [Saccostrea cucullata]|uniref:uncharacterized protein LOC134237142 isoform X2 n=1 Tax=Saccostrea cuccullata TaxID=36930 RepID=UPI002ED30EA0
MDLRRVFGILLFFVPVLTTSTEKKSLKGTGCLETILKFGFKYDACDITEKEFKNWFMDYFGYICSTDSECKKPNIICSKSGEIGTCVCMDGFIRVNGSCKKENICKCSETSTINNDVYSTNNNRKKESTTLGHQIGTYDDVFTKEILHVSEDTHNITILMVGVGLGSFILGAVLSLGIVFIVRKCRIQGNQNNDLKSNVNNPIYNKYIEGSESSRRGNVPDKVSTMPIAETNTAYSEVKILSDNTGDIYNHLHEQVTSDTAGLDSDYDHAKPLKEQLSTDREYSHLTSKIDSEDFKSNQQSAEIEENADENAKPLKEQLSPDREYSHRTSKIDSENVKSNQDVQQSAEIEENADENNDNYFTLEKIN